MASYKINLTQLSSGSKLGDFKYKDTKGDEFFLQKILADNPAIIMDLPELELADVELLLVVREYSTTRGNIDLLLVTEDAEIIIVETKLLKNPESTRTVVAQAIDYVKAFSQESLEELMSKVSKRMIKSSFLERMSSNDTFMARLAQNIKTGYFRVLVLGDVIHPNILGMVESIQSAPHLSFTFYLVELNSVRYDESNIVIMPKVVANTVEVERSVIRIDLDSKKIYSESPSPESKGTKPILTWQQYLDNVSNRKFRDVIAQFKENWENELGGSINMGTVGFSAGLNYGGRRIAIQFVYDNRVALISEKWKEANNIPEDIYREYREEFKKVPEFYDKYVIGNKVEIGFDKTNVEILKIILGASTALGKKIKNMNK